MLILPIKSIREEDGPIIGQDLLNLAKLAWASLPVATGVIITPPTITIKTVLEHLQLTDREIFDQKLTLVKQQLLAIPAPKELKKTLQNHKIDTKKLWYHLLEFWLNELRSKIWREGFSPDLLAALTAQPVFFSAKISAAGNCFYDYDRHLTVFELHFGQISEKQEEELEQLVKLADKKLLLPQIYDWVVEKGLQIVKVSPVTSYPQIEEIESGLPTGYQEKVADQKPLKSTIKVFLQADDSFKTGQNLEGFLVCSEKIREPDSKLLQLIEFGQTGLPVIFKLFDDPKEKIRGALNLIHKKELIKSEAEVVKFGRNKKYLNNIQLAIPLTRSATEFKEIKKELASLGLSRSGSLKFWLELGVTENLLNLEDYVEAGFDGALINLDELSQQIGGFDKESEEAVFYQTQIKALEKILTPAIKLLHKEKILTLAYGSLALHDDLLSFLMEQGVYGIAIEYVNTFSIQERLRLIERRIVRSRS